jgi:hypothetical protein
VLAILAALPLMLGLAAWAEDGAPMTAQGEGDGRVAIHFRGSRLDIDFETQMTLTGIVDVNGIPFEFEAAGAASGQGVGDSGTLEATVWATLRAHGVTETGEALTLRGGISIQSSEGDLVGATGATGSGVFYLIMGVGAEEWRFTGEITGDASGGFVAPPPEDPYAMVYAGAYCFDFARVAQVVPAEDPGADPHPHLPWDLEEWPEELSAELLLLLDAPLIDNGAPEPPAGGDA